MKVNSVLIGANTADLKYAEKYLPLLSESSRPSFWLSRPLPFSSSDSCLPPGRRPPSGRSPSGLKQW
jgi:hypothetical protein